MEADGNGDRERRKGPEEEEGGRDEGKEREGEREDRGEEEESVDVRLIDAFHRSVDQGAARLRRHTLDLLATGTVGGMDVSLGVLALLLVQEATGSSILGALAFPIGFIALALGRSELFTENFLVPIAAIAGGKGTVKELLRLWAGTFVTNMVGAFFFAWLIVMAFPHLHDTATELARQYPEAELGRAAVLGVLAGVTITFMTWTQHGATSEVGRLVSVVIAGFLLAAGHMHHVIVISGEMFVALLTGNAPFGYADWARVAGLATVTNAAGGLLLVTVLRLAQVGRKAIEEERDRQEPDDDELPELAGPPLPGDGGRYPVGR